MLRLGQILPQLPPKFVHAVGVARHIQVSEVETGTASTLHGGDDFLGEVFSGGEEEAVGGHIID